MTDKTREAIQLATDSKSLLENRTLQKWWESADKNLWEQFKKTPVSDVQRLVEIRCYCEAQDKMKSDFKRYVNAGSRAASKLGNKTLADRLLGK